jgi:hypothetical protein
MNALNQCRQEVDEYIHTLCNLPNSRLHLLTMWAKDHDPQIQAYMNEHLAATVTAHTVAEVYLAVHCARQDIVNRVVREYQPSDYPRICRTWVANVLIGPLRGDRAVEQDYQAALAKHPELGDPQLCQVGTSPLFSWLVGTPEPAEAPLPKEREFYTFGNLDLGGPVKLACAGLGVKWAESCMPVAMVVEFNVPLQAWLNLLGDSTTIDVGGLGDFSFVITSSAALKRAGLREALGYLGETQEAPDDMWVFLETEDSDDDSLRVLWISPYTE